MFNHFFFSVKGNWCLLPWDNPHVVFCPNYTDSTSGQIYCRLPDIKVIQLAIFLPFCSGQLSRRRGKKYIYISVTGKRRSEGYCGSSGEWVKISFI